MYEVNVGGIPAQARVVHYVPYDRGNPDGPLNSRADIRPPQEEEVEFELYDRKGYPAGWLESKVMDEDLTGDIKDQVLAAIDYERWEHAG